jgi:type I restriction enzyme S subunit
MAMNLHVCLPPLVEQEEITAFLDGEAAKLEDLKAASSAAIDLLRERRSALITAAVAGQIDVRGQVQADSSETAEAMA